MDKQNSIKIFKALSDVNRLDILELLKEGEKCGCILLEKLHLTQSGLSYHMKILCEAKIVVGRQEGKWTYYRLNEEGCEKAVALLKELTKLNSD